MTLKCDLCHSTSEFVMEIEHGDKKFQWCSVMWNEWVLDVHGGSSDALPFLIENEGCVCPPNQLPKIDNTITEGCCDVS